MPDANLTKLLRKTLIEAAQASVGSGIFKHMYVRDKRTNKELDTMNDGEFSVAAFVSGLLAMFGLIDRGHSVVPTTLQRMQEAGWVKIDEPRSGAVAHWLMYEGHEYMAICIDAHTYIGNSATRKSPQSHGPRLVDGRTPDAYYWHSALDAE